MANRRSRLGLAVILAIAAAGAATLLLRPRGGMLEAPPVSPQGYFSATELDRARDFRDLQRWIGLLGVAIGAATMLWLARWPPRRLVGWLERVRGRPLVGGALVGAGISIALTIAGLPVAIWAHVRAVDAGLSTQAGAPWLFDMVKSASIAAALAGVGGLVAMVVIRRFARRWWVPMGGLVAVFAVLTIYLQPIVVDPLFNRFEPLPRGQLRGEVLALADRAGVDVGEVYVVDASRRTTGINAYVGGLGHTKRVVIYDNLIDDFPRKQVLSVVAHELGHVEGRDLPRGLLWVLIVVFPGALLAQRLAEWVDRGRAFGAGKASPAALPAVALGVGVVAFLLTCAGNPMSRIVEARADTYALELTGDARAFIALERSLATRNLGDPAPPRLYHAVLGTHPTAVQRIGVGRAWAAGRRP